MAQDESVNGDLTIGTANDAGNLNIRRGTSGGEITGKIGFLGGGSEVYNLNFMNTSGGGYFTFYTNNNGTNERLRIANNGYVGIGTSNPTSQLHIQDNFATGWFQNIKGQALTTDQLIGIKLSGGHSNEFNKWGGIATVVESNDYANDTGLALYANELERLRISSNGNVGIGTLSPTRKLDVDQYNGAIQVRVGRSGSNPGVADFGADGNGLHYWVGGYDGLGQEEFFIGSNGNVGIGTGQPDAKLTVKGDIHTREVRVDMSGAVGPDFVFESDYNLRTLEETEQYIKTHKHLPEIQSAEDMDVNGFELKEMNLKLLQKVEELTLYLIEQNKEIKTQKEEVKVLKERISQLENE